MTAKVVLKAVLKAFIWMAVFVPAIAQAQMKPENDSALMLVLPPRPKVLGIEFDITPPATAVVLKKMGLVLEREPKKDSKDPMKAYIYKGTPEGLWVNDGKSICSFFKNKLIQIDFSLTPTYENFLLIRKQLYTSLGSRFKIDKKEEVVEDLLRTHLAMLKEDSGVNQGTEELVKQSIEKGTTFFLYSLKDNNNELIVSLSYYASRDIYGKPIPELLLHYALLEGADRLKKFDNEKVIKILPQ